MVNRWPKGAMVLALSLGAGVGLLACRAWPGARPASQFTLYFPPARGQDLSNSPRDWARIQLSSPGVKRLCQVLERQGASSAVLASACTLGESGRLKLAQSEPGLLQVEVSAESTEAADRLCQGLVGYLEESLTEFKGQAVDREKARLLEKNCDALHSGDAAEKRLVLSIERDWNQPAESAGEASPEIEREFLAGMAASRQFQADVARLQLEQETSMPGFTVVEASCPQLQRSPFPGVLAGCLLGLVVYGLAMVSQRPTSGVLEETAHVAVG